MEVEGADGTGDDESMAVRDEVCQESTKPQRGQEETQGKQRQRNKAEGDLQGGIEVKSMKRSRQAIKMHQKLFIKFNSSGIRDRGTACFREQTEDDA